MGERSEEKPTIGADGEVEGAQGPVTPAKPKGSKMSITVNHPGGQSD